MSSASPLSTDGISDMTPLPADQTVTDQTVTLRIKGTTGRGFEVQANRSDTILSVKQMLVEKRCTDRKCSQILLVYAGLEMEDGKTIGDYCAQDFTMAVFLRVVQPLDLSPTQAVSSDTGCQQ
jgi:hypothetical protein